MNDDDSLSATFVPGTETAIDLHGLLSFASVSCRGNDVYRTRPEEGVGSVPAPSRSRRDDGTARLPLDLLTDLAKDHAVYGGLDGKLYVVPLSGSGEAVVVCNAIWQPDHGTRGCL